MYLRPISMLYHVYDLRDDGNNNNSISLFLTKFYSKFISAIVL